MPKVFDVLEYDDEAAALAPHGSGIVWTCLLMGSAWLVIWSVL